MRKVPLIGIVIIAILIVSLFYFLSDGIIGYVTPKEGYETIAEKVTNRANPFAQSQNPLTNPAVEIGVSLEEGTKLTNMNQVALNVPTVMPDGNGSFTQSPPIDPISPRVDNENSYLGMVKMCKDKGVGENPFGDPAFAENCGMCLTSGTLKTGETFTTPTGVLVYAADKKKYIEEKKANQYPFSRAIPSIGGTCDGASRSDAAKPVLPITAEDYKAFKTRIACQKTKGYENNCAQCISNGEFTVFDSMTDIIYPSILWLWGSGNVIVKIAGKVVYGNEPTALSMTKGAKIELGMINEGTTININVKQDPVIDGPYVYGFITSYTPADKVYKLPIDKFLETDKITGTFIKKGLSMLFPDVNAYAAKIVAQGKNTEISLDGFIPLTFITQDNLAAYDCPTAPLVTSQGGAEFLVTDACLKPKGQRPGSYTKECLQQSLLTAGCSTNGSWYKDPVANIQSGWDVNTWISWLKKEATGTDPNVTMGCLGIDTRTPCDSFLNGGIPDKDCMIYLYTNQSEVSKKTGRSYNGTTTSYTSLDGRQIQFCQPAGTLNPVNANGLAELQGVAASYSGYKGIDAVKKYLSDVFNKAVGNLDINTSDSAGGRKDSWNKCIALPIANVEQSAFNLNSRGGVANTTAPIPKPPSTPSVSMSSNQNVYNGSYILSVNWSANSMYPITGYTVSLSGIGTWTVPPSMTSAVYGPGQGINVAPSTAYTFTVVAINEIGESERGSASITTPGSPPPPPPASNIGATLYENCDRSGWSRRITGERAFNIGEFPGDSSFIVTDSGTTAVLTNTVGGTQTVGSGSSFNFCSGNWSFNDKTVQIVLSGGSSTESCTTDVKNGLPGVSQCTQGSPGNAPKNIRMEGNSLKFSKPVNQGSSPVKNYYVQPSSYGDGWQGFIYGYPGDNREDNHEINLPGLSGSGSYVLRAINEHGMGPLAKFNT